LCCTGPGARGQNAPAQYPSQVLAFQPLTYWRFSEATPAVTATNLGTLGAVADGTYGSSLQPSPDTLEAPTFPGFGATDTGLAFNGTGQALEIGLTNIPTPWTAVFWVNRQLAPGGSAVLMWSSATGLKLEQWDNTHEVGFTAYGVADYAFNYQAPIGTWVNLAFVGTDTNTMLYVDGFLQDSNSASITLPMTSLGNAGGDLLNGTVDEVATWGTALLDGQIRTLYLTGVGDQNPPGFVQNKPMIAPTGTIYAGTPFSLSADVYGAGPLTYQWLEGGKVVGTNMTYAKTSASLTDSGSYEVIVTNPHGSATSALATLTITPAIPPSITQPPVARQVYPGGTGIFTVVASGTPPFFYQWKEDGTNIIGATNATLLVPNASAASAVNYSVGVTNAAGGVASSSAALTLTTPAAGSYEAVVLASGPISYWRLNEQSGTIAHDYQGGNDGFYSAVNLGQPGYSPLDTDTSAGFDPTQPSAVIISNSTPFDFSGLTPTFSCEVWGYFTNISGVERLFSNRAPGWGFGVNTASGLRYTTFTVQDFNQALPTPLQLNTWYHIAGVSDGGSFYFYLNGQFIGSVAYAGALLPSTAPFYLGGNPNQTGGAEAVAGDLAEAAFYDRALTPGEVLTHFSVGTTGPSAPSFVTNVPSISPTGTVYVTTPFSISVDAYGAGPLSYQWLFNGSVVGTNATYSVASATLAENGNYDVIVKSPYGSATSATVTLTVSPTQPPSITQLPAARPIYPGGTGFFTVAAAGTPPFSYQWKEDGTNLPGATNATLFVTNVTAANAVNYSVGVTNAAGGVVSSTASFTLISLVPGSYVQAVVTNGPINYWRLNETSGNTAYDYVGDDDGVISNAVVQGVAGPTPPEFSGFAADNTCYQFDGSTTSVQARGLGLTGPLTVMAWINPNTIASGADIGIVTEYGSWAFKLDGSEIRFTTPGILDHNSSGANITAGVWQHVAASFNPGAAGGARFYKNGQFISSVTASSLTPDKTGIWIGANQWGQYWPGELGDITIYDGILSDQAIATMYAVAAYGAHTAPIIVQEPADQTVAAGSSATLSVSAVGTMPLYYQWSRAGVPITGATNSSLTLANVPFAAAGTFSVTITNAAGKITSAAATLTVMPPPAFANVTNALVLHLTFNGNTQDSSGRGNNATTSGTTPFVPGKLGQAIQLSTVANTTYNYLVISDSHGDLSFDTTNSFSVALWLQFTNGFNDLPIIGNAVNSTYNAGWVLTEDKDEFEWTAVGTDTGSVAADPAGGPLINDGNWHHLAVVFDRGVSNAVSYVDGQWVNTRSIAALGNVDSGATLTMGQDPTGIYNVTGTFNVDDLGIWRRALSGYEVLSIYNAAQDSDESFDVYGPVKVYIAPDGAQVIIAWQGGTLQSTDQLQGAQTVWTAVSGAAPPIYTVPASAAHRFYRIQL